MVLPRPFDQHTTFEQRLEYLRIEQLIPQFAVEAFDVAVRPRRARLDEERLHADLPEPVSHGRCCELRAVAVDLAKCGSSVAYGGWARMADSIFRRVLRATDRNAGRSSPALGRSALTLCDTLLTAWPVRRGVAIGGEAAARTLSFDPADAVPFLKRSPNSGRRTGWSVAFKDF